MARYISQSSSRFAYRRQGCRRSRLCFISPEFHRILPIGDKDVAGPDCDLSRHFGAVGAGHKKNRPV